jgi:hypothetical protein
LAVGLVTGVDEGRGRIVSGNCGSSARDLFLSEEKEEDLPQREQRSSRVYKKSTDKNVCATR